MSEESPPSGTARPITSSTAALGWAIKTLRGIANALEAAPRKQAADALIQLTPTLQELERHAALVLPGATSVSRRVVLCRGPHEQVAAVHAKADDLFGGRSVSSMTYSPDGRTATFHLVAAEGAPIGPLLDWVTTERQTGRLRDVRVAPVECIGPALVES